MNRILCCRVLVWTHKAQIRFVEFQNRQNERAYVDLATHLVEARRATDLQAPDRFHHSQE